MAKIIFNADDYGFCDQVDEGVRLAIKNGYINSVAAFGNAHDGLERLKKLAPYQDRADIGCHLSITAGKPITDAPTFKGKDGYFRKFTELKRPGTFSAEKREKVKQELKKEIYAQVDVLVNAGIDVKHLSSHHNALVFFPEYFEAQIEVAKERGYRMRSTTIIPKLKNDLFLLQLRVRSLDNLDVFDVRELKTFSKNIDDWLEAYAAKNGAVPKMPDAIDGRHYGPLGLANIKTKAEFERKAEKKSKRLLKSIKGLKDSEVIEYCFHLCDPSGMSNYPFADENDALNYFPGVDWKYFDSRKVEFESLKITKASGELPRLNNWSEI